MNTMTNKQFELFLEKTIKNFGEDYIDFSSEWNNPYIFSKNFERKMDKLIKREHQLYFPLIKTPVRCFISIMITIIIALSMMVISVSAIREAFVKFITKVFSTHTTVQTVPDNDLPTTFQDIYEISEIPSGFELTYKSENNEGEIWLNYEYRNGNECIIFNQYLKPYFEISVNTEGYDMIPIMIDGFEGFIINMNEYYYIFWDNGDYAFTIEGNVSESALIAAAESVQKVENLS